MSGVNYICVKDKIEETAGGAGQKYILLPFYRDGKPLTSGKKWGMTLLKAGSMRFRWNEKNPGMEKLLKDIIEEQHPHVCSGECAGDSQRCRCRPVLTAVELIHSKTVYGVNCPEDVFGKKGDGLITDRSMVVPSVTVADCVPLFLYDPVTGVFGTVHSGWKGTGIIGEAVKLAQEKYGSRAEDMCVAIGPHIGKECYCIDEERKDWFLKNFGNCVCEIKNEGKIQRTSDGKVLKYSLDLTEANLFVLKNSGVKEENIVAASDCTCCSVFSDGSFVFGSFRRQAAFLPDCVSAEERSRSMTVQVAFVI